MYFLKLCLDKLKDDFEYSYSLEPSAAFSSHWRQMFKNKTLLKRLYGKHSVCNFCSLQVQTDISLTFHSELTQ